MPYYELYYHIVWSTKNRQPLLTSEIEPIIYKFLRNKAYDLEGIIHALNGMEDHVHFVATIPPKIAVAKFIGQIKGVASTKFNKRYPEQPAFFWQEEYSVFSFDKKRLPYVITYVEHQKEHHAEGRLIPVLERTEGLGLRPSIQEEPSIYLSDYEKWMQNMMNEEVIPKLDSSSAND